MNDVTKVNGTAVAKDPGISIDLDEPVQAHGEEVKQLVFRKPTADDLMSMGDEFPINIDWNTGIASVAPATMAKMMSRLAAVPPSTIKAMSAKDFSTAAHRLMFFFVPGSQSMPS
jgi:hypothetical protein